MWLSARICRCTHAAVNIDAGRQTSGLAGRKSGHFAPGKVIRLRLSRPHSGASSTPGGRLSARRCKSCMLLGGRPLRPHFTCGKPGIRKLGSGSADSFSYTSLSAALIFCSRQFPTCAGSINITAALSYASGNSQTAVAATLFLCLLSPQRRMPMTS